MDFWFDTSRFGIRSMKSKKIWFLLGVSIDSALFFVKHLELQFCTKWHGVYEKNKSGFKNIKALTNFHI
jgi:hypothetical protein